MTRTGSIRARRSRASPRAATGLLPCPTDRLTKAVIEGLPPSIRIISTFSVGYEHIDVGAAKARGIAVTNTPDVLTDATADIAAPADAGRGAPRPRGRAHGARGDLVELGAHAADRHPHDRQAARHPRHGADRPAPWPSGRAASTWRSTTPTGRRLPPEQEQGAHLPRRPRKSCCPIADFLSINCPATRGDPPLAQRRAHRLLPKGAIVVNTARGTIVDDEALIAALKSGHLAAAGLDVYRERAEDQSRLPAARQHLPAAASRQRHASRPATPWASGRSTISTPSSPAARPPTGWREPRHGGGLASSSGRRRAI